MDTWLWWTIFLASAAVSIFLLDKLLLWMEREGWIFYRKTKATSGSVSGFLAIDVAFQPGKKYVIEQLQEEKKECSEEQDGEQDGDGNKKTHLVI